MPSQLSIFDRAFRWWSPKRYCQRGLRRAREEFQRKSSPTVRLSMSGEEYERLATALEGDLRQWHEWLCEIEDGELVDKAERMETDLAEIPLPQGHAWHYQVGPFG